MYERVGGEAWFEVLTKRFYASVATDQVLLPLYPDGAEELERSRQHLCGFLVQYWGGPRTYSDQRGHPRLRMRHAGFTVGRPERDAWVRHMTEAVKAGGLAPMDETQMLSYLSSAATAMINTPDAEGS
jgi:hemoglobin